MQINNYLKRKIPLLATLSLLIGLSSCGSYQYVGVSNDGIYSTSDTPVQPQKAVVITDDDSRNDFYQNYFKTKSLELEQMTDDAIFTDIDSYAGQDYDEDNGVDYNYQGYAGWGQNNSDVVINIHSGIGYINWWNRPYYNHWGFYGWDSYSPYWRHSIYGGGFYAGFYGVWGYHNPYRYGYGYYGYPYRYPYRYYRNSYYNRGLSYSASRRGSAINRSSRLNSSTNSRSYNTRRGTTTRSSSTIRRGTTTTRGNTGVIRRGTTTAPARNSGTRSTRPAVRNNSNNSRSSGTINSGSTRRSSGSPAVRSSSSRSRSSGTTTRSSSSSSRSSGSTRSSSSSRRGGR
ncbi:hypothetical protein FEZ18_08935 [Oceanihabitans sp. IOP_32]|uniref:hypothetical protein n=1 Tax=Oceanihabitans sp. IOP_32 TaxID=2529032 RepID=UPI00129301A1|nr:hypothetical protein [Oceanihabitans sp. IOP_32]QFZ54915.1 hypothetical protein FEZ18_08935 [Oceanihabitans sp. IOP_32]